MLSRTDGQAEMSSCSWTEAKNKQGRKTGLQGCSYVKTVILDGSLEHMRKQGPGMLQERCSCQVAAVAALVARKQQLQGLGVLQERCKPWGVQMEPQRS